MVLLLCVFLPRGAASARVAERPLLGAQSKEVNFRFWLRERQIDVSSYR